MDKEARSSKVRYHEDFSSYPVNSLPVGYKHLHGNLPSDCMQVVDNKNEKALRLQNKIGRKDHFFCILTDKISISPGQRYRLTFKLKGSDCSHAVLGKCSDEYGYHDFQYLKLPDNIPDYVPYFFDFVAPKDGYIRLIIKNDDRIGELLIDEISLIEL